MAYQWYKLYGQVIRDVENTGYYLLVAEAKINGIYPIFAYSPSVTSIYYASHAIDGNAATYWYSIGTASVYNIYLSMKLGVAQALTALALYPQVNRPEHCFTDFDVYGSNDSTTGADGTWTLLTSGLIRTDDTVRWHEWTF